MLCGGDWGLSVKQRDAPDASGWAGECHDQYMQKKLGRCVCVCVCVGGGGGEGGGMGRGGEIKRRGRGGGGTCDVGREK